MMTRNRCSHALKRVFSAQIKVVNGDLIYAIYFRQTWCVAHGQSESLHDADILHQINMVTIIRQNTEQQQQQHHSIELQHTHDTTK